MKRVFDTQLIGPFAAMVIVALIVALTTERFLNPENLSNLSLQVSIVALIAIGSSVVIFAAGIDLSAGSMVALLTMILAQMLKFIGVPLVNCPAGHPGCWRVAWSCIGNHHRLRAHPFIYHDTGGPYRLSRSGADVQQRLTDLFPGSRT